MDPAELIKLLGIVIVVAGFALKLDSILIIMVAAVATAVVGGMLAATCLATLFIPFFFRFIMSVSLRLQGKRDPNEGKGRFEEDDI